MILKNHSPIAKATTKKKILYLIDTLEIGGTEKSLLEILQRARQTKPIVCHMYAGDRLKQTFEEHGIQVISLGLSGKYSYASAVKKTLTILSKEKPYLICTFLARSHFVGRTAGRFARIPVVSSFVNDSYSNYRFKLLSASKKIKLKATKYLDRITARWAFHFIANSKAVKDSMCATLDIPEEKVSVIYRGRDPSVLMTRNPESLSDLRNSLPLRTGTPIIVNVGRLIAQKGQKDLILAASAVRKESEIQVLLAGEGSGRAGLIDVIQKQNLKDVVTLLGERDDVPDLLQLADVFVFPSYYEGHSGSLIEAMFAGCPIIASDISTHRETINHNETGLLVPVGDIRALAQAMLWMLQHPEEAQRMGKSAQEVAMKRFHIDKIANLHEKLCIELLDRWENV